MSEVEGTRFADMERWDDRSRPHLWRTLGYRRTELKPGSSTVEWDAPIDYCFPAAGGPIVQGGMVTALLDAAMGTACWTVLDRDQVFLTADLRVEFLRTCRPGTLHAVGEVVRRTRRVVFCAATLYDTEGVELAASRCTQVVMPANGRAGRCDT
ncbi:MAG TPA: PaaI family thioesterase [Pseudonocardiaceae bacterium]|nr:PaaI family thioesterase [Pseudonocardiaceae bacterium]